jgi:hypothetical protein
LFVLKQLMTTKLSESDAPTFATTGITRPMVNLIECVVATLAANKRRRWAMSTMTKFAISAAIILSTAFSALAEGKPGATREQAASSGTGVAAYDRSGGIVSGDWR